ncbi:hypothetical protein P8452_38098 [Trifolium repens]|nr:hypothetical protein P8452_38098 [Trifolium repens]
MLRLKLHFPGRQLSGWYKTQTKTQLCVCFRVCVVAFVVSESGLLSCLLHHYLLIHGEMQEVMAWRLGFIFVSSTNNSLQHSRSLGLMSA